MNQDANRVQGIRESDGDADSYCVDGQYTEYEREEASNIYIGKNEDELLGLKDCVLEAIKLALKVGDNIDRLLDTLGNIEDAIAAA